VDRQITVRWVGSVLLLLFCLVVIYLALRPGPSDISSEQVAEERRRAAGQGLNDWPSYGRTHSEQRYSPLAQINLSNIERLGLAWWYDFDDHNVVESTPLVIDGLMYVTGAMGKVYALDAATGAELWRFDPRVPPETLLRACCQPVNRGAATWDGKIFVGTLDGRLVALDARSGETLWEQVTTDPQKPYTITGAPRVIKGRVVIGNAGAEYGVRGYVSAYEADTGELAWRFFTVPGDPALGFENDAMRMAAETWTGEWWTLGGGGTVWDAMAYDPELELLYIGTGNGAPWNYDVRSPGGGDNLFLASIVALRPDSGEYVWHYQTTPAENWDFTATQSIVLADLEIEGAVRKVLMQAPKNGFFYVLDRATGELISAQPFSAVNWASHVDLETGRPVERPNVRAKGSDSVMVMPGPSGAHNWNPMAFSQQTGLAYIPTLDSRYFYQNDADFEPAAGFWNLAYDLSIRMDFSNLGTESRARNYLLAWDPVTQSEAWRVDGRGGGLLATAGGLVFRGTAEGDFVAYDGTSGQALWSAHVQNSGVAGPISYQIGQDQYVAIALGRGAATLSAEPVPQPARLPHGNRVVAFKLDATARLPDYVFTSQPLRSPPDVQVDAQAANAGRFVYHRFCFGCHGREARGNRIQPDLRYSDYLDNGLWEDVVIGGALSGVGMVSFEDVISPELAEAIRAYVILEAQRAAQGTPR
jgi:alcohol dehydrogenase (cytochrome c)/quinohemoprotein ethanol dehydrogenase